MNNINKTQSYNKYLNIRDSEFGWDSPNQDKYGARIDRSNFKNSQPCIDVYGDSFTYGHPNEVYAWPSQLSSLVKCRVRNFGVGGYGSDQAFIKFKEANDLDPLDPVFPLNAGFALFELKKFEEAISFFNLVIPTKHKDHSLRATRYKALSLVNLNRRQEACKLFDKLRIKGKKRMYNQEYQKYCN